MPVVFVAGSMNIKNLHALVKQRLDNIVASKLEVVIGDANGVDASIQSYLSEHGAVQATIYCSSSVPRNNVGEWPVHVVDTDLLPGSRAFYTAKDIKMAEAADYGLMIWDTKSTGTLSNIFELLSRRKKSVVFVNKHKIFKTIADVADLEQLVSYMTEIARKKADEKIQLSRKIESLKNYQTNMF